jgi:hypothetical protein
MSEMAIFEVFVFKENTKMAISDISKRVSKFTTISMPYRKPTINS